MYPLYRLIPRKLLCILALMPVGGARAESPESPWLDDLPVVLSASRMPQPINSAPGSVTVIDGDLIRASGYRDLARIFRLVPGMQVGQERGNSYWVTYHGQGNTFPSELQVLVDGRSVYSLASFGGVDWSVLPVNADEIERIEIVRGPNPVTFGANAFMGVINIVTRHTASDDTNRLRSNHGDAQINDFSGITHFRSGDATFALDAQTRHDSGFANLRDSRKTQLATLRSDWRINNNDELMLRFTASTAKRGEGYDQTLFSSNASRDAGNSAQSMHLKWVHAASADSEQTLQVYHNHERYADSWTAFVPAGYPTGPTWINVDRNRSSSRNQIEFQSRESSAKRQTVWGVEFRQDRTSAQYMYVSGNPRPVDLFRFFGNLEEQLDRDLKLNLGAAVERYRGEPLHIAPRGFINWQASEAHAWRAGASRAWQQRPTFEKEGDLRVVDPVSGTLLVRPYIPNPDLKQARIDSAEIGYFGKLAALNSTLDVRLFNERIQHYIVRTSVNAPAPSPALEPWIGSVQYQNLDHPVTLRGVEYQLKTRPWQGADILFNHAVISRHSGREDIDDRTAAYVASLFWQQRLSSRWSTVLGVYRIGSESGGDGIAPLSTYSARPYTSFDARLVWQTPLSRERRLEISLNALNLGERHQEIPDRGEQAYLASLGNDRPANIASRTIYLGLSLDL